MLRAGNWEWYFPDEGEVSIASIVGYSQPSVSALMRYSTAMKREAQNILDMHYDTGDAEIGVVHMGGTELDHRAELDSTVYLSANPETKKGMWAAASSIEFGHWTLPYYKRRNNTLGDKEGPVRGRKNGRRSDSGGATWVEGIAPLQNAAKAMVRKRKLSIK